MARKLIRTFTTNDRTAKVYRDSEWGEWRVVFYLDGVKQAGSDYHAGDKEDSLHMAALYCEGPKAAPEGARAITAASPNGGTWALRHEATDLPALVGQVVSGFRGLYTIKGGTAPRHSASSGRVETDQGELFPSVVGCRWVLLGKAQ